MEARGLVLVFVLCLLIIYVHSVVYNIHINLCCIDKLNDMVCKWANPHMTHMGYTWYWVGMENAHQYMGCRWGAHVVPI